jgi:hypothetical protein
LTMSRLADDLDTVKIIGDAMIGGNT